jgi:uncharacterized membrane protein
MIKIILTLFITYQLFLAVINQNIPMIILNGFLFIGAIFVFYFLKKKIIIKD